MPSAGTLRDLLHGLAQERARTIATLLGIAWGTFAVVVLLAFGSGLHAKMVERAHNFGRGIAVVWPQRTTRSFAGLGRGRRIRLRSEDVLELGRQVPEIDRISPEYTARDTLQVGSRIHRVTLSGVYPAYGELRTWIPQPGGRFLNDRDLAEHRRVAVLGDRVKDALFGRAGAVGKTVLLQGRPFRVIGVMRPKEQDSDYEGRDTDRVCLPATTHRQLFGWPYISYFVFRSRSPRLHGRATDRIFEVLGRICRFDPRDRQALNVWDTVEHERMLTYVFLGFNVMLGGSGVLTLLVGGVGVGNLMFIRVRQRTREIGIQMALGATPRRILLGVLGESLVLVALGGLAGFLLSCLVAATAAAVGPTHVMGEPAISLATTLGTVALLGSVGLAAGFFPARRAAHLDPVAALME